MIFFQSFQPRLMAFISSEFSQSQCEHSKTHRVRLLEARSQKSNVKLSSVRGPFTWELSTVHNVVTLNMGLPWVTRGRQKRKQLKGHDNPYDGVLRDLINFIFVYAVVLIQKQTFSKSLPNVRCGTKYQLAIYRHLSSCNVSIHTLAPNINILIQKNKELLTDIPASFMAPCDGAFHMKM